MACILLSGPEVVYHVLYVIISFEFDYGTLCCKVCGKISVWIV